MRLILLSLACGLLAGPAAAVVESVEKLENYLSRASSGKLQFVQNTTGANGDLHSAGGELNYLRPNRFAISYEFPQRLEIVTNGLEVWVHDFELNQVVVTDLDELPGAKGFLAVLTTDNLTGQFAVSSRQSDGGEIDWLVLIPYDPDEFQFERCEMGFDAEGTLVAVRINDLENNIIDANFTSFEQSTMQVPDFEYVIPPGVEIVR